MGVLYTTHILALDGLLNIVQSVSSRAAKATPQIEDSSQIQVSIYPTFYPSILLSIHPSRYNLSIIVISIVPLFYVSYVMNIIRMLMPFEPVNR